MPPISNMLEKFCFKLNITIEFKGLRQFYHGDVVREIERVHG